MGLCPQFTSNLFLKIIGKDEVAWFKKGIFSTSLVTFPFFSQINKYLGSFWVESF